MFESFVRKMPKDICISSFSNVNFYDSKLAIFLFSMVGRTKVVNSLCKVVMGTILFYSHYFTYFLTWSWQHSLGTCGKLYSLSQEMSGPESEWKPPAVRMELSGTVKACNTTSGCSCTEAAVRTHSDQHDGEHAQNPSKPRQVWSSSS